MVTSRSLVSPTTNPVLERALRDKLQRRNESGGSLGELEPLAIRLGLMQNTLKPRLYDPQLLLFVADHGLAVDGLRGTQIQPGPAGKNGSAVNREANKGVNDHRDRPTHETVQMLLRNQLPLTVFARAQQMQCTVVDCGVANTLQPHDRLLMRKIAHGTRNARVSNAMTLEQAHAGMRAGMEIGDKLPGNVTVLAGVGVGSHESAALVLSRLTDSSVRDLVTAHPHMDSEELAHLMVVLSGAQGRHRDVTEPIEVLAAFGGFEVAVMVGVIDGLPACAALMLAARIAQPVTDYCVFCRSHSHRGLDQAFNLFRASALLELGMESTDGTGATLAWPLVRSAAALLTEVADGEEAGPTRPGGLTELPAVEVSLVPPSEMKPAAGLSKF
jgi:nicotinate-nucleotide--dimethylbenzimidazole phosphoribosyltransferase